MISFQKEENIKDYKDLKIWADVENAHFSLVTRQVLGIGMMWETWSYKSEHEHSVRSIQIYDEQSHTVWQIFNEVDGVYAHKEGSLECQNFRRYSANQWTRLRKKNSAHYIHSTKNIEC